MPIKRARKIVIAESLIRDSFLDGYSQGFRDGKTMGFEMRRRINKGMEYI
jgi:hypothetical protein